MKLRKRPALITAAFVGVVISAVFVAGWARRAHAATQETCTVNGIFWQTVQTTPSNDLLLISCTDGTSYDAYIGTPAPNSCYMDADTAKAWAALAMAARITGNTLTIWWNTISCPGNTSARIPSSVTLN